MFERRCLFRILRFVHLLSEAGLRPTMLFELFVALRASFNFGFVAVCLIGDIPNWFLLRASFPSKLSQRRTLFLNYLGAIPILPRLPQRRHSLKVRFMFGDGVRRVRGLYLLEVFSIDDHAPLLNNPKVSNLASLVHTPRKVLLVALLRQSAFESGLTFLIALIAVAFSVASSTPSLFTSKRFARK